MPTNSSSGGASPSTLDASPMHLIEMQDHAIHIYETPTQLKMVMITDSKTSACPPQLWRELHIAYTDHAMKNPFHTVDEAGIGQPIRVPAFTESVRQILLKYTSNQPSAKPAGAVANAAVKVETSPRSISPA